MGQGCRCAGGVSVPVPCRGCRCAGVMCMICARGVGVPGV